MASRQHLAWIARGKPWRLARPLLKLRDRLRGYGYTVYDLGNDAHLDHIPPERHTPYSETNWSARQGLPMPDVVTAIDIMPRTVGMANRGLPTLQQIGAQMFADRQAGHPEVAWLVGMNWGPSSDRTAVRDTWRPGHVRRSSSDAGHIHAEGDSSMTNSTVGDSYDPVARILGQTAQSGDEDMQPVLVKLAGETTVRLVTMGVGHLVVEDGADLTRWQTFMRDNGMNTVVNDWPAEWRRQCGPDLAATPALAVTPEVATAIAQQIVVAGSNNLTAADLSTIRDLVVAGSKQAAREGTGVTA